jgi:F0F1-type ATP synthase assembly protein I
MVDANQTNPWRMFSLGLELALAVLVLGVLGWVADGYLGTRPWLALLGGGLGFIGGMYRFILRAMQALRDEQRPRN